ncbi:MAG: glucosamine-6-phosphate deaminase [Lentisphaerae bacterium]|nr:glucosamine-6-phosphate deaminase [Lentisphaerota bacterium]
MQVIIQKDEKSAVLLAARIMADALRINPEMVFGLATGATMEAVYAELTRMYREENLDFSGAKTFNLDEYIGLAPEDKNSYRYYMNKHLFDNVNIKKSNTHLPNGMTNDVIGEGKRYEAAIQAAGGIDLQLLGIGQDGHIGFNEPLSSLGSRTRDKSLTPETYRQNSIYFDPPESMPRRAFTMGVGTILDARRILMLITGERKAQIAAKALEGPVSSMISASAVQFHSNVTVILDEAAASELQGYEYYRWAFENEPAWESYR